MKFQISVYRILSFLQSSCSIKVTSLSISSRVRFFSDGEFNHAVAKVETSHDSGIEETSVDFLYIEVGLDYELLKERFVEGEP